MQRSLDEGTEVEGRGVKVRWMKEGTRKPEMNRGSEGCNAENEAKEEGGRRNINRAERR